MGKKDEIEKTDETGLALPKQYFQDNANVGLSGLTIEDVPIPTLTVVQSNSKMRDEEGRPLIPGKFYYKALKASYEIVECSILVITKKEMPSYEDRSVMERNYMVLGCLYPGQMPFIMYNKSSAYFSTRQFIGEVKARKMPMYVLKVQLSTEKRQNDKGEWYMPIFNIVGVEEDPNKIMVLEELAKDYDMNQEGIRSEDEENRVRANAESQITQDSSAAEEPVREGEEVNPDEIPF